MNPESKYVKIIEWSEVDQCFVGSCPELFYGGCHGDDEREVFNHLCQIIEETIELYKQDGKPLPMPLSGKDFVTKMQKTA
ncbi:MAG: pilus assembly protein HicB [Candidatus Schekmanbacteria bacterium RBG_13_48_7]|uniref:Pilus assembly protein HicB n=1 Tax=Candidatus Schekmanbacteria bacterium RBG_13_48_7 TaxID=1817878 RepID=A0A1F7RQS2_9BACT|nr:MAG: pilus assembly protein HicB [Candidatus Schekmanbacteria bacterium RBG_13_48_7]